MNWHKKKDSKDKILHDTFTAYLTTAIHRRRLLYIEQQMRTQKADIFLEHLLKSTLSDAVMIKEDSLPSVNDLVFLATNKKRNCNGIIADSVIFHIRHKIQQYPNTTDYFFALRF